MAELFRLKTSIDWVEVNYHGNAPALADLIAGHVDIGFQQLVDAVQLHQGRQTPRARGARARSVPRRSPTCRPSPRPAIRDVRRRHLQRRAGAEGHPARHRSTSSAPAIRSALQKQTVIDQLAALGSEAGGSTPEAFADFLTEDTRKWSDVMKQANIKVSE